MKKYEVVCDVLVRSKFIVLADDKKIARKLALSGDVVPASDEIVFSKVTEISEVENESDDSE
tara:strand:+ start:156 stop:341 length:186 start_codon:yes stop_codon:yes gene_type:complete